MIRLKYGGLLLAAILFFTFTITASAQYSFRISTRFSGKCKGVSEVINVEALVNSTMASANNYLSFPTLSQCEAARSAFNYSSTLEGCTYTVTATPCVGSPLPGAGDPGTGTIYKGSGSTYSASPANEVKDWAKDNATLMNIIGGQNSNQFGTVQTGDKRSQVIYIIFWTRGLLTLFGSLP